VVGGLGAVPGFGWWPIKAYKPCAAFTAAGLEYTRWVIAWGFVLSVCGWWWGGAVWVCLLYAIEMESCLF
jgi:hypothetical protein